MGHDTAILVHMTLTAISISCDMQSSVSITREDRRPRTECAFCRTVAIERLMYCTRHWRGAFNTGRATEQVTGPWPGARPHREE